MHDRIQNEIPRAMRAKDRVRLTTLRGMIAAFINESVVLKRTPKDKLSDSEAIIVIRRLVKQRKDSIEQFEKGGRKDLVENEKSELEILEEFLPAQIPEEQIEKIARLKIEELGADKSKMGILIGAVMKECKGEADGTLVKKIVEEILS